METRVQFDHLGIAAAIKRNRLSVPLHQREYVWETRHVRDLLSDIAGSMHQRRPLCFLGTLVLTVNGHGSLEVADGQQRLATTTLLLAAFRDIFLELDDEIRAESLESDYLFTIDLERRKRVPKLSLNAADHDFFVARILSRPAEQDQSVPPSRDSHRLLQGASKTIKDYFGELRSQGNNASHAGVLLRWISYLTEAATVITMVVPDDLEAFSMFETLNNCGLRASQADLVKNHLLKEAGDRRLEARDAWSSMRRTIDSAGEGDLTIDLLRHACTLLYGPTREREVFQRIKAANQGPRDCLGFLALLGDLARDYAAIHCAEHSKWNSYPPDIRASLRTLKLLASSQIRPLLLGAARRFSETDAANSFKRIVAWCVRFVICGDAQNGDLDRWYGEMANAVHVGRIKGLSDLDQAARAVVPTDARFRSSFETARVDATNIARYKLRSLEREASKVPNPEWHADEMTAINLEPIMPRAGSSEWSHVAAEDIETHSNRLGNLVLVHADGAVLLDCQDFETKKKIYARSTFSLTLQVAGMPSWGVKEIEQRQKVLAALAVKTWRIA